MLCRLILSISILFSTVAWAVDYGDRKIGVVTVAEQPGWLERESGTALESNTDVPLEMMDRIETFQGAHRLTFIDETIVDTVSYTHLTLPTTPYV